MNKIKFSIIIPCYNVAEYIDECVLSVLNQKYDCFEVLLVNDGSTDGTAEKCEQYSQKDERVKYLKKNNGGLSDARNYGLEHANGDYIFFVDGDDYISSDALEIFSDFLGESKVDILTTRLTEVFPDGKCVLKDHDLAKILGNSVESNKIKVLLLKKSDNLWPAQKYIIKKEFVNKNKLRFLKGFLHEDMDWTSRLFLFDGDFGFCPIQCYYHRMKRRNSITNTISSKNIIDVINMANPLLKDIDTSAVNQDIKDDLIRNIMISVYDMFPYYKDLSKEGKKSVIDSCIKNKEIFKKTRVLKYKIFSSCCILLGYRFSFFLLSLYTRLF